MKCNQTFHWYCISIMISTCRKHGTCWQNIGIRIDIGQIDILNTIESSYLYSYEYYRIFISIFKSLLKILSSRSMLVEVPLVCLYAPPLSLFLRLHSGVSIFFFCFVLFLGWTFLHIFPPPSFLFFFPPPCVCFLPWFSAACVPCCDWSVLSMLTLAAVANRC